MITLFMIILVIAGGLVSLAIIGGVIFLVAAVVWAAIKGIYEAVARKRRA